MNIPPDEENSSEKLVKQKAKEIISSGWGDLPFVVSIFLLLFYAIVITILDRFGIKAAPWTFQLVINIMLFLWGTMGLVIVVRGEYRDRYKGIQRGFPAYVLGSTLMLMGWLPIIAMLTSSFFK
jgi:hypothetical protein